MLQNVHNKFVRDTLIQGTTKVFLIQRKRVFFVLLSSSELFIESSNVYIETKRNVDSFFMHLCVVIWRENQVLTNPNFPTIRLCRDASKKLYKDSRFFSFQCTKYMWILI